MPTIDALAARQVVLEEALRECQREMEAVLAGTVECDAETLLGTIEAALSSPDPLVEALRHSSPDDLRALGWSVAVHNDYRQGGEQHTFWLLTKDGHAIKGEGRTDAEALNQARANVPLVEAVREVVEISRKIDLTGNNAHALPALLVELRASLARLDALLSHPDK